MYSILLPAKQAKEFRRWQADALLYSMSHTVAAGQGDGQRISELRLRQCNGSS